MSNNNSQEYQQQLAEQLFCVSTTYKSIVHGAQADRSEKSFTVVFNDIFQLAKGNSQAHFVERSSLVIKKINADLNLRKTYLRLVKQFKFAQSGQQVAASSGEALPDRVTEHFSLKFKRDVSQPSQVYVILTINHPAEHHLANVFAVHITNDNVVDCIYFPTVGDGRSQLLMEDTDSRFKLLIDPNSQLYLT